MIIKPMMIVLDVTVINVTSNDGRMMTTMMMTIMIVIMLMIKKLARTETRQNC